MKKYEYLSKMAEDALAVDKANLDKADAKNALTPTGTREKDNLASLRTHLNNSIKEDKFVIEAVKILETATLAPSTTFKLYLEGLAYPYGVKPGNSIVATVGMTYMEVSKANDDLTSSKIEKRLSAMGLAFDKNGIVVKA